MTPTVRVFANHELLNFRGYAYEVSDAHGGTFTLTGARVSYFDIDKFSKDIKDAGLAYNTIYDANGNIATDPRFLAFDLAGFSRFCSSVLVEAGAFESGDDDDDEYRNRGLKHGLEDTIYFTGEEDGGDINPANGREAVLASTGVDTYAVDPVTGNGADTFGTLYTIETRFRDLTAALTILYDGDADPTRALRSPDNLDWADDGYIYVQEDEAEEDTLTGEPLFGDGAANPNEAGIEGGQLLFLSKSDDDDEDEDDED